MHVFAQLFDESLREDGRATGACVHPRHAVPVLARHDPRQHGSGVELLRSLVDERLAAAMRTFADRGLEPPPGDPIPREVVERLAYYSGGLVNELARMMEFAAGEAWGARATEIGDGIVEEVLLDARRAKEWRIDSGEIALLERVMEDPDHALPPGPVAQKLLAARRLLVYGADGASWCFPHPLLTLVVLGRRSSLAAVRPQREVARRRRSNGGARS